MKKSLMVLGAFTAALTVSSTARASFHEIRVSEIFAGTTATPTAQYVQLVMYVGGQTFVSSGALKFYDATGTMTGSYTPTGNVTNGAINATILIGTSDVQATLGVAPDFVTPISLPKAGGAVCWTTSFPGFNDCATWGNFTGAGLPNQTTNPFSPSTGLPLDQAMHRTGGDTDHDAADFALAAPLPTNNSGAEGSLNGTVDMAGPPHDLAMGPHDLASGVSHDMAGMPQTSNGGGCAMGGAPSAFGFAGLALALVAFALARRRSRG